MNKRGRPVDPDKQAEQKQRLLESARELLSEKSYRSITIRELGDRAGVNSAMVRYYFENKEGLFVALLDKMSAEHFSEVQSLAVSNDPIRGLIEKLLQILSENSGLARMIHDEVLSDDSPLQTAFIERFPTKMAQFLPLLVAKHCQIDDPQRAKYLAFSLMTLIIMPFVGEPVRKLAWHISDKELTDPRWANHVYSLFMYGCKQELN
ncbi:TetR/AcrR family transcriptional regulator [Aliikangiella marina]|uniref:TetR/AcrR family transcriptional regulator n=1 Tax=Aliikangiella marina TaxID=1712262 RepID=A0A545T197_9GAMM|nr:TetR/AcrR family transcriptional regulator [Aliikangiella marina]TQV70996.1 TetR/AcrR family transcriptional regulator [Aliikangiella marina]